MPTLPMELRWRIFRQWLSTPVLAEVARQLGLSVAVVRRVAEEDRFRERAAAIREAVLADQDERLRAVAKERMLESLELISEYKALIRQDMERLRRDGTGSGSKALASDLVAVVAAEAKLLGFGGDRLDVRVGESSDAPLRELNDADLLALEAKLAEARVILGTPPAPTALPATVEPPMSSDPPPDGDDDYVPF